MGFLSKFFGTKKTATPAPAPTIEELRRKYPGLSDEEVLQVAATEAEWELHKDEYTIDEVPGSSALRLRR